MITFILFVLIYDWFAMGCPIGASSKSSTPVEPVVVQERNMFQPILDMIAEERKTVHISHEEQKRLAALEACESCEDMIVRHRDEVLSQEASDAFDAQMRINRYGSDNVIATL